jgi:tape measure domain-containing protein
MTKEAKSLLKTYVAIKAQYDKNGQSLDAMARKEREKSLLRKKELTTEAEYLEKIRILEERVANTRIGSPKRTKYIAELDATREKYESISHSQRKVNRNQDEMKSKIALTEAQMKRLNDSFRLADHYTGRLLVRLAAYAGVALFARMLRNIREVTAEFELQQVALGAIIQDTDKANTLFEQIKTQAVRSPFEVKELVTYTKQLAAYRVETERLFDVTMQLADISAALGVDMQRLILAYGQVKAASVLRGQELRQFTEAGIPLVQKLADKFTELRGRVVSTGEVFGLISRRAVSFGMIEEIFNDMTAAGGEFYKMQEKQAETLKGRWTNLKDAISIAYDEIGRSKVVNGALNGLINMTSTLAKNWRKVNSIIVTVAGAITYFAIASKNARLAASALTEAEVAQAIADGKLTLHKIKTATATETLTKAEIRRNKFLVKANAATIKATMATNAFTRAGYKLSASINTLFAAIGPAGWVLLGISAIISVITIFKKRAESLQETLAKTKERAADYINMLQRTPRDEKILDQYDKLSEKMDKTAEESKKLLDISKRLASVYPEHATLVDAEAMAYNIDTEAIRKNTEAKQENMRVAIESDISTLQDRKNELEKELAKFYISPTYLLDGTVRKDLRNKAHTLWSNEETLQKYQEFNKELADINAAIKQSEDALNFQMIKAGMKDFDELWKRQIRTLSTVEGFQHGFADDTIQNFETIEQAWDEAAKQYKEREETLSQMEASKASPAIPPEQMKEIQDSIDLVTKEKQAFANILDYYNQWALVRDKGRGGGKTDTSMFKDELDLVKRIYKKYVDLRKIQSEPEARESIKAAYGNLTAIDFLSPQDLAERIADIRRRALAFAANSADEDVKKAIQDFVDTADEEIDNVSYTELENAIKERLDSLAKDLSAAKEAGKFYDEIFGKTFDRGLAEAFTASIYGADRTSARNALKDYVSEVFDSGVADIAFGEALMPNWGYLEEILKERASFMSESQRKAAQDIIASGRKTSEEQYRVWVNDLSKEKDVLDKRIDLHHQTAQRIREIEGESDANVNPVQKAELVSQYRKREQKLAADIAYQAFKESPAYTQMFANLDNASVEMLRRLKSNIEGLHDQWQNNLDPANLKELQKRIEEIDKQLTQKRPFETLAKGLKEYYKYAQRRKNADKTAIESAKITDKMQKNAIEYATQLEEAEQKLRDMQEGRTEASAEDVYAQMQLVFDLREQTQYAKQLYENAKQRSDADAEDADHWRHINELIYEAASVILGYESQLKDMNDLVFRIAGAWKYADDIQKEYLNNLKSGIDEMIGGVATLGKGILEIKGGKYFEGIVDVIVGVERAIEGALNTANAQELRDINREIERQDTAISNLEKAYNRLRDAEEKTFGSEWIANRNREIEIMEAQAEAYRKKADAEMRKSDKDRDEAQAREWYKKADEIKENISQRAGEISRKFLGTDLASAARDFASAWVDAYKSFGNTIDAMDEKFHSMVENMVKESVMAKVIQERFLDPIFKQIDELGDDATTDQMLAAVSSALQTYNETKGDINDVMVGITNILRSYGIDLRDTASGLTGISKDIAQASESSILGLAAGINTQNFYISGIYSSVGLIVEMMQARGASVVGSSEGVATGSSDYTQMLTAIADHTFSMAQDISSIKSILNNVVSIVGQERRVKVSM